jgi:YVTN family beta-propeller protein
MKKIRVMLIALITAIGILLAGCGSEDTANTESAKPLEKSKENSQEPAKTIADKYYFTANEGGTISKVNAADNKVTATLKADGIVHNIQISPDGKVVAATLVPGGHGGHGGHDEENTGSVLFYDAETDELLKTVSVGNHPAHVVYSKDGKYVLVTNNEDDTVSVIDASNYEVKTTITTGKGPHGFRISDNSQYAYIANMGEDTVSVINIDTLIEERKIDVGKTPVTTGITSDGKTLAVTLFAENAMAILDLETNESVKVDVGVGPAQVYIGPDDKYAYVANQGTEDKPSSSMSIVELVSKTVVAEIETGKGAHGVVTSADGKFAYVTNMFENTVSIINLESKEVSTIDVGEIPNGITIME